MTVRNTQTRDLTFLTKGQDNEVLTDPAQDPAQALPDYVCDTPLRGDISADMPTQDEIEAALNAHVRGEGAPWDLMERLFNPFTEAANIELEPGKGLKRPSYVFKMRSFDVTIGRASTAEVAEHIHKIAAELSRYPVGKRAPKESPSITIEQSGRMSYPEKISITAPTSGAARNAYAAISGSFPNAIHIPLKISTEEFLKHAIAARDIITMNAIGAPRYRQKAIDLISATQDLRTTASVLLRRNPRVSRHERHWIDLTLGKDLSFEISDKNTQIKSSHEALAFSAKHMMLMRALSEVASRHPVLRDLPASCKLCMDGEPKYLSTTIKDMNEPQSSIKHQISSSLIEYSNMTKLADRLEQLDAHQSCEQSSWSLEIDARCRSKPYWDFQGQTLTHGIVNAIDLTSDRASMELTDLIIDLMADEEGHQPEINIIRILRG